MNNLIRALSVIGFLLVLAGCSDKYNSLYDSAPSPLISFDKDTLSIREKDYSNINATNKGVLKFLCNAATHQLNLTLSDSSGRVHFEYKGVGIRNMQPLVITTDTFSLYCNCDTAGKYPVRFYLSDQLDKVSSRILLVDCAANKKAIPSFTYTAIDTVFENWSYRFDASASIKQDGIIQYYHFSINGIPFVTNTPVIEWVFHSKGLATISLFLSDDLKLNSDTITKTFLIP